MSLFGFGQACSITVEFKDQDQLKQIEVLREGRRDVLYLFGRQDAIVGRVNIELNSGKKIDHMGIRVEMLGQIELFDDRGNHVPFMSLQNMVSGAGELTSSKSFPFEFTGDKQHDSYHGINARLRFFIRVTVLRNYQQNISKEVDFWVRDAMVLEPQNNNPIKMEVGIEDCLQIEFEYKKEKYHLTDVVIGKVYFIVVRIVIKHMEIALIKRESTGSGANLYNSSETVTKFEVMDGAPVRGECLPVRFFLGCYDLSPTYRNVNNKFSVKYYLNLVLVDQDDRRYFKQHEIILVP